MFTACLVVVYFLTGMLVAKNRTVAHFATKESMPTRQAMSEYFIERTLLWPFFILQSGGNVIMNKIESDVRFEIARQKERIEDARLAEKTFKELGV